jgi:hypothetical protein
MYGLTAIENKIIVSFHETQEVTNKLLLGDTVGIKNQVRDMRDDMKEFRREVRWLDKVHGSQDRYFRRQACRST